MYQRILVPIDGSPTARKGLDEALKLAKATGASVRLVHVIDPLTFATGFEVYAGSTVDLGTLIREAGEALVAEGRALLAERGVPGEAVLVDGIGLRVADAVADQARRWGAELIVIGTHGRRGVGRLLMGSDAEQIVRSATVPVLLVRSDEAAAA